MSNLIFQTVPAVTLATNTFINVPTILRFEDTNLIEIIRNDQLTFTTQIPIYHPDGTYLAKVNGTRMFLTEDGKKAGLKLDKLPGMTVCKLGTSTLFEIKHQPGDAFKTSAELYTPEGCFVKVNDDTPEFAIKTSPDGGLQVGNIHMSGNLFHSVGVGIWLRKDGGLALGAAYPR